MLEGFGRHLEGQGSAGWRRRVLGYLSHLREYRPDLAFEERIRSWILAKRGCHRGERRNESVA